MRRTSPSPWSCSRSPPRRRRRRPRTSRTSRTSPTRRPTAARRTTAPTSSSRRSTAASTRSPARTTTACRSSTSPSPQNARDRGRLRLRRHPGRRPGLPPGRPAGAHVRDLHVGHVRRRHLDVLPRGRGARLRRPQAGRHGPQRHVHRRADRPAGAEDRLVRRGHAGLAQPDRAPERQLPLQLELGPDHVDPAGDRGRRHLRPGRAARTPASSRCPTRPGLGTESHDITFNADGTRAYSAALSQGVIIDTTDPANPTHRHELRRPGDQRLAPGRPGPHRRPRVPDRRGRVRRRARHRPVPERRRARLRHHRRATSAARSRSATGTSTPSAHHRRARRPLHRARVRHPRGRAGDDDRLLQRRRPRRRPLRPGGHLARRRPARRGGDEGDRELPLPGRRHVGGQDAAHRARSATSTCTATTSPAGSTSTAIDASAPPSDAGRALADAGSGRRAAAPVNPGLQARLPHLALM